MTPHLDRSARRVLAGLGAIGVGCATIATAPFAAAGAAAPAALAASAGAGERVAYGHLVTVSGHTPERSAGRTVALQWRAVGGEWRTLAGGETAAQGSYSLSTRLRRTGAIRVVEADRAAVRAIAGSPSPASGALAAVSPERAVVVGARISAPAPGVDVLAGVTAVVRGRVTPAVAGRRVALQIWQRGRWRTVSKAATRRGGAYRLSYWPAGLGSVPARVRFGGDTVNGATTARVAHIAAYRAVEASWYDVGGGAIACSGLSGVALGVAHKTLPCGTKVRLRYGRRTVVATVIDRGPFVAGREFDLTGPVKRALGFGDLGQVWSDR